MKPDKNATNNLIDKVKMWTPYTAREILIMLKQKILPDLEEDCSIEYEEITAFAACFVDDVNDIEHTEPFHLRSCYEEKYEEKLKEEEHGFLNLVTNTLQACIQELDNYTPPLKAQIVDAALAKISGLAEKAERLKEMLPKVKELCDSFDKRTKEIITIVRELMEVESNICPGYKNYHFELLRSTQVNISVLRDEFSVKPLVEAYDLAISVDREMRGGQQGIIGPSPAAGQRKE